MEQEKKPVLDTRAVYGGTPILFPPPPPPHSFWCTYGHLSFSAQAPSADSGHRKRLASTPAAGKRVDKRADKGNSLGFLEDPMLRRGELVGL